MPARLLACPSCARHVRVDEARCPFCGAECPESFASSPELAPPPRARSRAELLRLGALVAAGAVGGGLAGCDLGAATASYGTAIGFDASQLAPGAGSHLDFDATSDVSPDGASEAGGDANDTDGDATPDDGGDAEPDASLPSDASDGE